MAESVPVYVRRTVETTTTTAATSSSPPYEPAAPSSRARDFLGEPLEPESPPSPRRTVVTPSSSSSSGYGYDEDVARAEGPPTALLKPKATGPPVHRTNRGLYLGALGGFILALHSMPYAPVLWPMPKEGLSPLKAHGMMASIALVWLGMVLAISFFEAWRKFQAQTLTRKVGLDVGRTVFHGFNAIETIMAFLLLLFFFIHAGTQGEGVGFDVGFAVGFFSNASVGGAAVGGDRGATTLGPRGSFDYFYDRHGSWETKDWLPVLLPFLIVTLQVFKLQPTLDKRAITLIMGEKVPPSAIHAVYVLLEIFKVGSLAFIGGRFLSCL
ncbi:Transmembrane protein [Balamuthia mandrillaris]